MLAQKALCRMNNLPSPWALLITGQPLLPTERLSQPHQLQILIEEVSFTTVFTLSKCLKGRGLSTESSAQTE